MILSKKRNFFWSPWLSKLFMVKKVLPTTLVHIAFKLKYPRAKVVIWKQIDVSKWRANFEIKGTPYSSLYTSQGHWVETVRSVSLTDIPDEVQNSFGSQYGNKGLKHIYLIKTPAQVIFEIRWSNGVFDVKLLYNDKGKMIGKLIG